MKRVTIILLILSSILLVSCSGTKAGNGTSDRAGSAVQEMDAVFHTVCSADEALALSRKANAVVFEQQGCTSGSDVWDSFYQAAMSGSPAAVLCAHYYALDKERMSEALYEEEKDRYPTLFFYLVEYDGKEYSVKTRESNTETTDYQETFRYLLHFTGDAPASALYAEYDNYVLVDDPNATWEGIQAGLFSARSGAGYKHCTVYRNRIGG